MSRVSIQSIKNFFLTRIIIGILVVGGSVVLIEWTGRLLLDKIPFSDEIKSVCRANPRENPDSEFFKNAFTASGFFP